MQSPRYQILLSIRIARGRAKKNVLIPINTRNDVSCAKNIRFDAVLFTMPHTFYLKKRNFI